MGAIETRARLPVVGPEGFQPTFGFLLQIVQGGLGREPAGSFFTH
jgi:hypothetical protein